MEHQKIINLLDNTPNQLTKFRAKSQVDINDHTRGTYSTKSQIKFKTSVVKSILCDYSDAYIIAKGPIIVGELEASAGNNNILVVFKNCAPFADCINEINNAQMQ